MKKLLLFSFASFILFSCGSVSRTISGSTEKKLVKTVSVEQGCDQENIKVLDRIKRLGGATYSLDVCGKRLVYKQVGSVFMEQSVADKMLNN